MRSNQEIGSRRQEGNEGKAHAPKSQSGPRAKLDEHLQKASAWLTPLPISPQQPQKRHYVLKKNSTGSQPTPKHTTENQGSAYFINLIGYEILHVFNIRSGVNNLRIL